MGNSQKEADALVSLANIRQFLDEPETAIQLLQQSLALAQSMNDPWRQANVYFFLGWDRRDFQRALSHWEKALLLYRKAGDQVALANLLGVLGQFRVLNGDIELGEKYIDESLSLWKSHDRANIWQNPRIAKSLIAQTRGDHEQAYTLLQESLLATSETGNRMSYLWVRARLGHAGLRAGKLEEARSIFDETARSFQGDRYSAGTVFTLEGMAYLYFLVGKLDQSARLIGWADATRETIRDPRVPLEQADVDRIIAACLTKMGEVAFSDTYDDGQKMSLDEAVTYALQESPVVKRRHGRN
jgi:non-specific serine/threonine protein kinase